jgi:hypothetical protein
VDPAILERTAATATALAEQIGEYERSAEDRRVLADETRERLARLAEETRALAERTGP